MNRLLDVVAKSPEEAKQLILAHHDHVSRVISALAKKIDVSNDSNREDRKANAFLYILENIHLYNCRNTVKTYCYKMILYSYKTDATKYKKRSLMNKEYAQTITSHSYIEDFDKDGLNEIIYDKVLEQINLYSERDSNVLKLYYLEDHTIADIEKISNIKKTRIGQIVHQFKMEMRELLRKEIDYGRIRKEARVYTH